MLALREAAEDVDAKQLLPSDHGEDDRGEPIPPTGAELLEAAQAIAAHDRVQPWDRLRPGVSPGTVGREPESMLFELKARAVWQARHYQDELDRHKRELRWLTEARRFDSELAQKVTRYEAHLGKQLRETLRTLGWGSE